MALSFWENLKASFAPAGGWPADRIAAVLKRRYDKVSHLGREQGFSLFGVEDKGVNFVVALIAVEGAEDRVAEIAFLARFVGFDVTQGALESINRNLHISVLGVESGDLFLIGGVAAAGAYQEATFMLLLDAWGRDLLFVLQSLSGRSSIISASPIARSEAAMSFAANRVRSGEGADKDLLVAYLSAHADRRPCGGCEGRGKRGLVARMCESCDGTGFVSTSRERR